MKKLISILLIIALVQVRSYGQDTLPEINVVNINNNILVSWSNPFTSLTTINIQRSYDSTKNFKTIGSVIDVKNKKNGYVDANPPSNQMFYRVFLSFEGGVFMFSDAHRPIIDTTGIIPAIVTKPDVNIGFIPSKYIYTGKYNSVIINLPEAASNTYHVKFYDEDGSFLFQLKRIDEPYLILEKVNFPHSGAFKYELFNGEILIEKYKVYIPRDGKINANSPEFRRN
ncbi:hypothetical protein BH09BAC2_BH09BAC2_10260 [soil metagenome]